MSQAHAWADWLELLCLTSLDGNVNRGELEDRLGERGEVDPGIDDEEWSGGPVAQPGTAGDRFRRYATDVFGQLAYRSQLFGSDYPFQLAPDRMSLQRRRTSVGRRLYLFLLLASSLRYVKRSRRARLTSGFERLVAIAVRSLGADAGRVYVFGTSVRGGHYSGLLRDKIRLLAGDIGEDPLIKDHEFAARDTGDSGLDVVAWPRLGDELGARMILFVQATCSTRWVAKQAEVKTDRWGSRIRFTASPAAAMAIPFAFRSANGDWQRRLDIENVVLLDRSRLMYLLPARRELDPIPYDLVREVSGIRLDPF